MENEKRKGNRGGLLGLIPALLLAVLAAGLLLRPGAAAARPAAEEAASPVPYLAEEESFFSDFTVRGDRVYFLCYLCVENPGGELQAATITGDFLDNSEDGTMIVAGEGPIPVKRVLGAFRLEDYRPGSFLSMSDEELAAAADRQGRQSEAPELFLLYPGENRFWVIFSCAQDEAHKEDRLLPPISICPLRDVTPEEVLETTGCRIFKDPDSCEFYLADGERCSVLGTGFGGYGFTSAVPWDYDGNGTVDLLYTYSWGSGMHRSHLSLFDRTKWEEQALYVYYPWDYEAYGSDLLVEKLTDESGAPVFHVYTADVTVEGHDFTELRFTKKAEAGVVDAIWNPIKPEIQPLFWPASRDFFPLTEEASAADPPNSCEFYMADIFFTFTGEKAAELLDFCQQAEKQAELGDFYVLDRSKPLLKLIFTWDNGISAYYQIDWKDKGIFGISYANAQAALQFPAGTYDALLAMWGEAGDPVEEAEALDLQFSLQSCSVTYGGGTAEVSGETAEELYRICRGAMELGELISPPSIPAWESSPPLRLAFRVIPSSGAPEDTDFFSYAGTFLVYRGFDDDFALFAPNPYASINAWYRFPAGTYDALMEALTELGEDTETIPLP